MAGKPVAVGCGTNHEKLLIEWSKETEKADLQPVNIKYYQNDSDTYLALQSGRIDLYFGAGATLQGLIVATTKKDSGPVKPLADALNEIIHNGTYAQVLEHWGLYDEAVTNSEINPP